MFHYCVAGFNAKKTFTNVTLDLMQRGVGGDAPGSACIHEPYLMRKGKKFKLEFEITVK